ncbi:hypothetical protein L1049_011875 [Liquidambar formosana]|uniref:Malectin-like domain-containing protein n=1 Tax=Liquidambar formosana TaxID=63359 RepID=A0AAP0RYZ6_LIQFO
MHCVNSPRHFRVAEHRLRQRQSPLRRQPNMVGNRRKLHHNWCQQGTPPNITTPRDEHPPVFPHRKQQNCYNLPMNVPFDLRYLIRAGFYYGDYDGHSRPPAFDLHLDGKKWSTVNTSSSIGQPIYHEAYYRAHWPGQISVCLVQTRHGEVPFISSLEAVPLSDDLYSHMKTNSTFLLVTRTIFGAPEIRDDAYDRIWTSGAIPPNSIQVSTTQYSTSTTENDPPLPVLMSNIQSPTPSDPIILSVDLPQVTPQSAYFVFYLTDVMPRESFGDTRIVDIYINGQKRVTVFSYQFSCYGVTIYPVILVGPTVNVTLAATNESTLPPIVTAMEIFTRADQSPSSNDTHEHLSPMYLRLVLICLLSWLF